MTIARDSFTMMANTWQRRWDMRKKQDFEKIYVKFAVKSPVVYYIYLFDFI